MAAATTLLQAIEGRGPYAVWDLMTEEERQRAAAALWTEGDRPTRAAIELALAKDLKFRPQSLRRLPVERILARLVRMADTLPDTVLFQFLFHLHLADRRPLLAAFLDALGLPHTDGVLELADDTPDPDPATVTGAATALVEEHGHQALVYLATLRVADAAFWQGVDRVLERHDEKGEPVAGAEPEPEARPKAKKPRSKSAKAEAPRPDS